VASYFALGIKPVEINRFSFLAELWLHKFEKAIMVLPKIKVSYWLLAATSCLANHEVRL